MYFDLFIFVYPTTLAISIYYKTFQISDEEREREREREMKESVRKQIRILRCLNVGLVFVILGVVGYMIANGGPVDGENDVARGFWVRSSNVDWCERNYVYTEYVAEMWNSLSSVLMIFSGIYGAYVHRKMAETRFMWAFLAFAVVGTGSALFHGTLLRGMQLMDELPMVWCNTVFLYIVITMNDPPRSTRWNLILGGVVLNVVLTYCVVFLDESQDLFLVAYGSGVGFLIVYSLIYFKPLDDDWTRKARTTDPKSILGVCGDSHAHLVFLEMGVFLYGAGFALWLIDRNFCPYVQSFQLHSMWHIGADLGTYTAVLGWMYRRLVILKRKPRICGNNFMTRRVDTMV